MSLKRAFDLLLTVPGLVLVSPVLIGITLWIKLDSPGPVLFRQVRVGRHERPFEIFKFRTMRDRSEKDGPQITIGEDPRITRSGRFLRKTKLDELAQVFNVLRGEMSLVGPRPEVPTFVARYPEESRRKILSIRPGITDEASWIFRDESTLLAQAEDPIRFYVEQIMPRKIAMAEEYVDNRSSFRDMVILLKTLSHLVA